MATASPQHRVLATADSQIGYSRWSDSNRGTKYARETQPVFWPRDTWLLANGISYCDLFITWVFWKALGKDFVLNSLPGGASYNTDYRASKGGRVSKSEAAPGDVLVFDWNWGTASTNHVGILEKRLSGSRFQTIEGNTSAGSSGSQSNGGRVARRVRRHDQVRYVIRPDWSEAGGTTGGGSSATAPWDASATINGLSTAQVKAIQTALSSRGYSLGSYGIDGSYGESTYEAVKSFQRAAGLSVDGVAGPKTVAALNAAHVVPSKPVTSKPRPVVTGGKLVVDSKLGPKTGRALQEFLNDGRGGKLKADSKVGAKTWAAFQRYVKAPHDDGEVSRQSYRASEIGSAITGGWDYTGRGSTGSPFIELVQRWVGVKADGVAGPATVRALQIKLNAHAR